MPMRRTMVRELDTQRIEAAIAAAEARTSGEIRVSVAPFFVGNVRRTAERAFERLGMSRTRDHNGVLLFIVPSRRELAILGDTEVHRRVGQTFWDELTEVLSAHFREERFTEGLVEAIEWIGQRLAEHFPTSPGTEANELPDAIDFAPLDSRGNRPIDAEP